MRYLMMLALAACGSDDPDPTPDAPPGTGCVSSAERDTKAVTVSGQVIDFATAAPVAGATVDVTTAWDVTGNFPHADCPLLATLTTGADGRFGPTTVMMGSIQNPSFAIFLVHGAGRAQTASDNRTCSDPTCNLGHTIAAPSTELAAAWRTELAAGGMPDADARGLVAFLYRNNDGTNAVGVTAQVGEGSLVRPLAVGREVRFLDTDRSTLAPAGQATTIGSGVALVGVDAGDTKAAYIDGTRGAQTWAATGTLVEPGYIFLEDKLGSP